MSGKTDVVAMAHSQRNSFGVDANGLGVEHVSVHDGVQKSVLFARLSSVEPTPEEPLCTKKGMHSTTEIGVERCGASMY
jgi:hypothetical protein